MKQKHKIHTDKHE